MNNYPLQRALFPKKIAELEDYVPVETDACVKLDANENPYPMPDLLRNKLAELALSLEYNRYPDPYTRALNAKFAEVYNVAPERLIAGCGSDEVLHLLCQTLLDLDENVLTAPPDFSMYAFYAYLANGELVTAPRGASGELIFNQLKILASNGCKCVMFSNPCNPTSSVAVRDEVLDFVRSVPCVVVVDEAYGEFCSADFSVLDKAGEIPNLIVLKTMSKAFGLAALRIGFAVAHEEIVRAVLRVKSPYNLSTFSQAAGVAALEHADEIFALAKKIGDETKTLYTTLAELAGRGGYNVTEPGANFVLLRFADMKRAENVHTELLKRGISIRYSGADTLRVTCGTEAENRIFMHEFNETLKGWPSP